MASSSQTFSCNPFAEELSLLGGNNLSLSQSHSKLESLNMSLSIVINKSLASNAVADTIIQQPFILNQPVLC